MPVDNSSAQPNAEQETAIAIAWCLAWGSEKKPRYPLETFERWRCAIAQGQAIADSEWQAALTQAATFAQLAENDDRTLADLITFATDCPELCQSRIGLVYGGVTKVKSYVFESADLQEVRGASALLDRINLVDLPALFHAETSQDPTVYNLCQQAPEYCKTVRKETFAEEADASETSLSSLLSSALIPELIVYSTGGNILAFCPPAFTDALCNAIEKRYTTQTLTANSCAVGATFRALEIYCGLLKDPIETTLWHEALITEYKNNKALQAYFGFKDKDSESDIKTAFKQRKNFGELVGKLTSQFNQRRSGDDSVLIASGDTDQPSRPSRRYPPMFETHPYLLRDNSNIRSVVAEIKEEDLPNTPKLSEPSARKRRVGQLTKRDRAGGDWYENYKFQELWDPAPKTKGGRLFQSWVTKFERFLGAKDTEDPAKNLVDRYDPSRQIFDETGKIREPYKREARSLHEIGDSSKGYVAYIYADGNNMGQYIREQIKTPAQYQAFSRDIFEATEQSVYYAIAQHLQPQLYKPSAKSSRQSEAPVWIHPFEIITIGGDDVLLIVPANKALEVAQTIGDRFEALLLEKGERYVGQPLDTLEKKQQVHRYLPAIAPASTCKLSTSSGVLITAADTPIYYADKLVSQLLKSAKKQLKLLKKKGYHGGTVDFLVLKAVTMITSDIEAFRKAGLTIEPEQRNHRLKLYAAPYTLHELKGLINTVRALKQSQFPKSQLYQIRSLLSRGKRTAILNYRYFRVRLETSKRQLVEEAFESAWCEAKTNGGNLAPWMTAYQDPDQKEQATAKQKVKQKAKQKTEYETIWHELVALEPFISADTLTAAQSAVAQPDKEQPAGQSVGGAK